MKIFIVLLKLFVKSGWGFLVGFLVFFVVLFFFFLFFL